MNSETTYSPTKGDYIKLGPYPGVVLDIYWNADQSDCMIKIMLVKNIFQRNRYEIHDAEMLSEIQPADQNAIEKEIRRLFEQLNYKSQEFFNVTL